jgi:hypothetical protein
VTAVLAGAGATAGAARGFCGGGGETAFGSGGGGGAVATEGRGAVGAAAAAGGGAGAGDTAAAGAGLLGVAALTAVWQGADSWAMCCFRQASASAPPRGTPEQFAMKSDRHDARIALI